MNTAAPRIATKRENTQKSTGPKIAAAKAAASNGAIRRGLLRTAVPLDEEDQTAFDAWLLKLRRSLALAGAIELWRVEDVRAPIQTGSVG